MTAHDGARHQPMHIFENLGELLYTGADFGRAYDAICTAARILVDGCDHASLMQRNGDEWSTPAATDEVALAIDKLERTAGTGPCFDAIDAQATQLAPDIADPHAPWPKFRELLLAHTPVRGMMGLRVFHQGHRVAALNLFSDVPGGFTDEAINQAVILAAFATVALQSAADRHQVTTLREGLVSNREIGQAVGLLMAHHRISENAAFEMLRTTSNGLNIKLAAVAREVVQGHTTQVT